MKTVVLSLAIFAALFANAGADFENANQKFAAGDDKAAIADYEADVRNGSWSANLFYDLGNAYFRAGDAGRAILNYERALAIEPHHPEAQTNLQIAREQSRALEMTPGAAEKYAGVFRASTLAVAAAVCFWLGVILLMVRRRAIVLSIVCFIATGVCAWALWTQENARKGAAIVVSENAQARVATADTARSILALPPGSEVVILQERGEWNYAALPDNQRGWIAAKATEKVRL